MHFLSETRVGILMVEDLENVLDILSRPDNFQLKKIQPDLNVKTKETLDDKQNPDLIFRLVWSVWDWDQFFV